MHLLVETKEEYQPEMRLFLQLRVGLVVRVSDALRAMARRTLAVAYRRAARQANSLVDDALVG